MSNVIDRFSVADAAVELGVNEQRVRALIDKGILDAEKFAGRWMISAASVRARRNNSRRGGRPLSQQSTWELIDGGLVAQLLARADRSAMHNVRVQLGSRAEVNDVYVLPRLVGKVEGAGLSVAGRALAEGEGIPAGVDKRWALDSYIRRGTFDEMCAAKVVRRKPSDPNVRLRVVDDDADIAAFDSRVGRLLVAWLDLADDNDRAADITYDAAVRELRSAGIPPFPLDNRLIARLSLRLLGQIFDELGPGDYDD